MCFMIFLNEETPHQTIKTRSSKGRKIGIFPKGLVHRFGQKMEIFPLFLKRQIGQTNVFYDIQERRNASLDYENKKLKKSKNWDFSKGVSPWFWSKIGNFSTFLFQGIQARRMCFKPEKCVLRYCTRKKRLSRLQKQEFEKV